MTTWGSTENGDPVFDNSCWSNLQDINLIITKALNSNIIDRLIQNKDRCVLHLTVTGLGGSFIEPCVPKADLNAYQMKRLLEYGFPVEQAVLRIDPMLSVDIGKNVLDVFADTGVKRCRFSFLDMTNYTDNRKSEDDIKRMRADAEALINYSKEKNYNYTFESCAGAFLKGIQNLKLNGCMSAKEAEKVLGYRIEFKAGKRNRDFCLAPADRVELLKGVPCKHNCRYCFHSSQNI